MHADTPQSMGYPVHSHTTHTPHSTRIRPGTHSAHITHTESPGESHLGSNVSPEWAGLPCTPTPRTYCPWVPGPTQPLPGLRSTSWRWAWKATDCSAGGEPISQGAAPAAAAARARPPRPPPASCPRSKGRGGGVAGGLRAHSTRLGCLPLRKLASGDSALGWVGPGSPGL